MRRLAVISGKLGGLQAMLPMLRLFQADPTWQVSVFLCDQHYRESRIARSLDLPLFWLGHADTPRTQHLLQAVGQLATHFERSRPDVVVVYGDRADALLGATVAHEMLIPVAHLQAGDLTGGIDNANRYAITALATWAFCSTEAEHSRVDAQARIMRSPTKAYVVGDHHIDAVLEAAVMLGGGLMPKREPTDRIVCHMHPDTLTTWEENRRILRDVVAVLREHDAYFLPPCTDVYGDQMWGLYAELRVTVHDVLPLAEYVRLLLGSWCLVGNTSACILDAPALGVPTILVGQRQVNRGDSVVCETRRQLRHALSILPANRHRETCYGTGQAGKLTYETLCSELPA